MKCRATAANIDQVKTDCTVLAFFEDERPLKGTTGLADWRLCGSISRYILEDLVDGHFGEVLLFPIIKSKLKAHKALMIGLGPKKEFNFESYSVTIRKVLDALFKLRVTSFSLELPGLAGSDLDATLAANRFCEALAIRYRDDKKLFSMLQVSVLAVSDQIKKLNPILGSFEKKSREELGVV